MAQVAAFPMPNTKDKAGVSLVDLYIDHELLKNKVNSQDLKLDEILTISKDNQQKLTEIDNIKKAFKTSWKFVLIIVFLSFMCGLAVDDAAVVKKIYHYFTFS